MSTANVQSSTTDQNIFWSTLPRFIFGPIGLVAILALTFQWPFEHWFNQVLWTAVASYCFFCWTSCFHEAAHHTLCGSQSFSVTVGRCIGTMIFVPFHVYRESHIRHHAYLNKSTDWELWPYSDPKASIWFRRFFCWLEIPFGLFTSPFVYGRLYFHPETPLTNADVRRKIRNEYIVIVVAWSLVLGTVAATNSWIAFLSAWGIPHAIAGVFQTFRKFTEHLGMSSYDPLLGTRTVIGKGWITKACTYFNFDIFVHGPHHRHPRFRHEALCNRMDEYQVENPDLTYPVFPTYWSAIAHLLPSLIFNPGVGMNAGAPPPAEEKSHDVSDFGVDITKEILSEADTVVHSSPESVASSD